MSLISRTTLIVFDVDERLKLTNTSIHNAISLNLGYIENLNSFNFVYTIFEFSKTAFANNQAAIIQLGTKMFSNSIPSTALESEVLNRTFNRLTKNQPTLLGRK